MPHSVTPKKNLATKKPAMLLTIPSNVATIPKTIVRVGSQKRGVVSLRRMLPIGGSALAKVPFRRSGSTNKVFRTEHIR